MGSSKKHYTHYTVKPLLVCLLAALAAPVLAFKIEEVNFDTTFGLQTRVFDNNPISPVQRRHEFLSAFFEQEISYQWNGGLDSWVFTPYFMITRYEDPMKIEHDGYVPFVVPIPVIDFGDTRTAHRSYGDVREFLWTHIADSRTWEVRTGIGQVFWGVAESQHLVDVINQKDLRADIDGEVKLGQPMINLTLIRSWGNLDFFVLPGFRERVYQENVGRLGPVLLTNPYLPIAQINATNPNPAYMVRDDKVAYESGAEELHTDAAFRWSHSVGVNDIGLSWFQGTNREPVLYQIISEKLNVAPPVTDFASEPSVRYITPYYEQMTQFGVDYQATLGNWLLKFEGIYRDSDSLKTPAKDAASGKTDNFTTDYTAVTAGFEYTITNIFDSPASVGLILEYLWDSREFETTHPYQDDVFAGIRYTHTSTSDPSILLGLIQDMELDSYVVILETSRRIAKSSKIIFEIMSARADKDAPTKLKQGFDATAFIANEDHARLAWETYY